MDESLIEELPKNADGYYVFKNTATAQVQTGTIGSSSETTYWKKTEPDTNTIHKSGTYNKNYQRLEYELTINPDAQDLSSGDTLEVTDTLSWPYEQYGDFLSLELNRSSITLYEVADDESLIAVSSDDWSWTCGTVGTGYWQQEELKVIVPDGKKFVLKYSYNINILDQDKLPADTNDWCYNLNVSNNATISGYESDSTSISDKWEKSSTSGSVTSEKRMKLRKVEKNNFGKTLPGAKFTLYKYQKGEFKSTGQVYTTDTNGLITIKFNDSGYVFAENTAYWLKETAAPEGYLLDETAGCYFYFADSGVTLTAPSDFTSSSTYNAINLRSTGKTIEIENEPIPTTSLEVDKKWFDSDGNDLTNSREGKISFEIWRAQVSEEVSTEEDSDTFDIHLCIGTWNPYSGTILYDNTFLAKVGSVLSFEIKSWGTPDIRVCPGSYWDEKGWEKLSPASAIEQDDDSEIYSYSYVLKLDSSRSLII